MAGGTQRAAVPVGDSQLVSFSSTPSCCPPSHPHPRGRLVSYSLASVAPSTSCFAAEPRGRVSHLTRGSESESRGESKVGRKRPPSTPPAPPPSPPLRPFPACLPPPPPVFHPLSQRGAGKVEVLGPQVGPPGRRRAMQPALDWTRSAGGDRKEQTRMPGTGQCGAAAPEASR